MNAIKLRFTFALAIACVLSMAAFAQQSTESALTADTVCPATELNVSVDGGGSSGGEFEVHWESLVPGVFK